MRYNWYIVLVLCALCTWVWLACMATLMNRGVQLLPGPLFYPSWKRPCPPPKLARKQQIKSNQAPLTAIRRRVSSEHNRVRYGIKNFFWSIKEWHIRRNFEHNILSPTLSPLSIDDARRQRRIKWAWYLGRLPWHLVGASLSEPHIVVICHEIYGPPGPYIAGLCWNIRSAPEINCPPYVHVQGALSRVGTRYDGVNVARRCSNVTCERRDNTTMSEELLELAILTMLCPHNIPLGSARPKGVLYTQASGDADRWKWRGLRIAEGTSEGQSNHYCGRPEPICKSCWLIDFLYHACVCLSVHQLFITFMTLYMTIMYFISV